ncbi:MAG TPA: phosphate ABC transporter substrate-binding protein PstS [Solirubrobacteraceae bacterium]|nr:phosphate ABC transporter substrate-binding protein PstS [Solirubrobacteraceae bacterium]
MRVRHLSGTVAAALAAAVVAAALAGPASAATPALKSLSGAGSTLVAPLVAEWGQEFPVFYGVHIQYQSVGSQAGLNRLASHDVDFAATDSPLTSAQHKACPTCGQIPWTLTGLGIGYHVKGAGNQLRLTPSVLAKIYLGKITKWNDRRITSLNPGVTLPALSITPIYTNASGDTSVFTQYLSKVSSTWRTQVGTGDTVNFPIGVTSNGNAGMTTLLQSTNGAIGYVGAAYLITHKLPAAAIENAAGDFQYPNLGNIVAAGATVKKVPDNGALSVIDPPKSAPAAYPLSTFSYVVVPANADAAHKAALRDWIAFAIGGGQKFGEGLDFAPVPSVVAKADRRAVQAFAGS